MAKSEDLKQQLPKKKNANHQLVDSDHCDALPW